MGRLTEVAYCTMERVGEKRTHKGLQKKERRKRKKTPWVSRGNDVERNARSGEGGWLGGGGSREKMWLNIGFFFARW